jgi:hypothetical protein
MASAKAMTPDISLRLELQPRESLAMLNSVIAWLPLRPSTRALPPAAQRLLLSKDNTDSAPISLMALVTAITPIGHINNRKRCSAFTDCIRKWQIGFGFIRRRFVFVNTCQRDFFCKTL